jgi:hypothetical protein
MDDAGGKKQIIVDMYFIAGIGKRTETYPFIAASTGRFTQVCFYCPATPFIICSGANP